MLQETVRNYVDTLNNRQKNLLYGVINLNIKGLEISWDFDQVLMQTEIPVADFCDKDLGTHYAGRKIRGWNSFSKWLFEDGIKKTKEEADAYEDQIWTDPKVIKEAPVNKRLQALSYVAWTRGIKQTITTSRIPELAAITEGQVKMFYPWLIDNVNQRRQTQEGQTGEDFKVSEVFKRYLANPNLVHLDDSMTFMRKLLRLAPEIDVIGFPCVEDDYLDLGGGRRIFFPDISMFNEMINYPDLSTLGNVAQSH